MSNLILGEKEIASPTLVLAAVARKSVGSHIVPCVAYPQGALGNDI
ncbi:MAG: hypothetical protein ABIG63_15840 [Chloroflexota bacterium]